MRTKILAVDGLGGAGKSTLAAALATRLAAPIVHTDDFASWDHPLDWWPRLLAEVLEPLSRNEACRFRRTDWEGTGREEWVAVEPADVVILEGVGASRAVFHPFVTCAVWVETPREERLRRGLERDGEAARTALARMDGRRGRLRGTRAASSSRRRCGERAETTRCSLVAASAVCCHVSPRSVVERSTSLRRKGSLDDQSTGRSLRAGRGHRDACPGCWSARRSAAGAPTGSGWHEGPGRPARGRGSARGGRRVGDGAARRAAAGGEGHDREDDARAARLDRAARRETRLRLAGRAADRGARSSARSARGTSVATSSSCSWPCGEAARRSSSPRREARPPGRTVRSGTRSRWPERPAAASGDRLACPHARPGGGRRRAARQGARPGRERTPPVQVGPRADPEADGRGHARARRRLGLRPRVGRRAGTGRTTGKVVREPVNLGPGWQGFDFEAAFGRPTKVMNDAAMQAIGSYEGGRMLFLGLGTGLGSTMIVDGVHRADGARPSPVQARDVRGVRRPRRPGSGSGRSAGVLPCWRPSSTCRRRSCRTTWCSGGGLADELDDLPAGVRVGGNELAFVGGFRLWE